MKNRLFDMLKYLKKNIFLVAIVAIVCVVLTMGYTFIQNGPSFRVYATVLVHTGNLSNDSPSDMPTENPEFSKICERLFNTYEAAVFFKNQYAADLPYTADELDGMISVKCESRNSLFMRLTVECDDPNDALYIAENYIYCLSDYSRQFSSSICVNKVDVDRSATPNKPMLLPLVATSFVIGALGTAVILLLFAAFDQRIKSAADLKAKSNLRLLGTVPEFDSAKRRTK